tara:strand:+ start:1131 stop:1706 length:576 start_codon:yes stop_codon:yes gene_type:complete
MANGPKKDDIVMTETVTLDGFQAVMQPGKYGYSLTAIIESDLVDQLNEKRAQLLEWGLSKVKNPKRSVCKPEPWEEVAQGKFKIKCSWGEDAKPGVVDSVGTDITNPNLPLYGGSKVRLALWQKPYVLKDGVSYGTSLKCVGVQVVDLGVEAGVSEDLDTDVTSMFGTVDGFKAESLPEKHTETATVDDDF